MKSTNWSLFVVAVVVWASIISSSMFLFYLGMQLLTT